MGEVRLDLADPSPSNPATPTMLEEGAWLTTGAWSELSELTDSLIFMSLSKAERRSWVAGWTVEEEAAETDAGLSASSPLMLDYCPILRRSELAVFAPVAKMRQSEVINTYIRTL